MPICGQLAVAEYNGFSEATRIARMKLLTCIFTYNRPLLLANCVNSVEKYFPWGERLVLDDGSEDPAVSEILDHLARRDRWTCRSLRRDGIREQNRRLGGFYQNMAYAISFALENGYDFCFFLEDDGQLCWLDETYPEQLMKLFDECPDAVQASPLFLSRLDGAANLEYVEDIGAYRTPRGFNTTGVLNLKIVRQTQGFRFIDGTSSEDIPSESYLPANSRLWLERGYRLYWQRAPLVARIMWLVRRPSLKDPLAKLNPLNWLEGEKQLLRPLSRDEIGKLRTHRGRHYPCQEYFFDGRDADCVVPLSRYAGERGYYYRRCRSAYTNEKARSGGPLEVSVVNTLEASRLQPLPSHIAWGRQEAAIDGERLAVRMRRHLPGWVKLALKPLAIWLDWSGLGEPYGFLCRILMRRRLMQEIPAFWDSSDGVPDRTQT